MSKGTSQDFDGGLARARLRHHGPTAAATTRKPVVKRYGSRLPVSGKDAPRKDQREIARDAKREARDA